MYDESYRTTQALLSLECSEAKILARPVADGTTTETSKYLARCV